MRCVNDVNKNEAIAKQFHDKIGGYQIVQYTIAYNKHQHRLRSKSTRLSSTNQNARNARVLTVPAYILVMPTNRNEKKITVDIFLTFGCCWLVWWIFRVLDESTVIFDDLFEPNSWANIIKLIILVGYLLWPSFVVLFLLFIHPRKI